MDKKAFRIIGEAPELHRLVKGFSDALDMARCWAEKWNVPKCELDEWDRLMDDAREAMYRIHSK